MKKSVKILSAVMAVVLIFACGVGATLAYLHNETSEVKNTFSAKNLTDKFELTEHEAKPTGPNNSYDLNMDKETSANSYEMVPGMDLPKDPFVRVTVKQDAYLFVEVTGLNNLPAGVTATVDTATWTKLEGVTGAHSGDVYYRTDMVTEGTALDHEYILTQNTVFVDPTGFDPANEDSTGFELNFYGYLTQATNFADAAASWNATYPDQAQAK